jgi:hypothetical protein
VRAEDGAAVAGKDVQVVDEELAILRRQRRVEVV